MFFRTHAAPLTTLVLVLGGASAAHADADPGTTLAVARPHNATRRAIEASKAGLRLEVDAMCEAHHGDAGADGATCPVLSYSPETGRELAMLMGDGYSVDILVEERAGAGQERAQRAVEELCAATPPEPSVLMTFGGRSFLRAASPDGGRICFVTADSRPELAAVVFRSLVAGSMLAVAHPEFVLDLAQEADAVMATVRMPTPSAPWVPVAPVTGATGDMGSRDLRLFVLGLAVVGVALFLVARRSTKKRSLARASSGAGEREQLAGSKCAVCMRNIVSERAATHCDECDLPIHRDCLGRHVTVAHGPPPGAYR